MVTTERAAIDVSAERRHQRNAVIASFLGWTFDAFDFFVLTFLIADIAKAFGELRQNVAFTLTLTLAMRPVGALIFGVMADRYGRRLPMTINIVFYAVMSALSGLAPTFRSFLILRALFGIGMGGQWGIGASLVLESVSPRWRGVLSGLLHQGYSLGNLLAALAFLTVYPTMTAIDPAYAWRVMFFLGGLPALLSIFVLVNVKESEAWQEHRTDWRTYWGSLPSVWRRFLYLVLLLTMMGFISHGTQDLYPTFLQQQRHFAASHVAETTMFSMVGAIIGGLVIGYCSDRFGRRRAMIGALLGALLIVPLWIAAPSDGLIVLGGFLMQFCVQGAWGVIPAHMNELSPGHLRGFLPGFAYQIGMLCAGIVPYVETVLGEHFTYAQSMGFLAATVLGVGMIVIGFGPEAHGITFRKDTVARAGLPVRSRAAR
jgi:SHS family lactate transporter-like MFS transporter